MGKEGEQHLSTFLTGVVVLSTDAEQWYERKALEIWAFKYQWGNAEMLTCSSHKEKSALPVDMLDCENSGASQHPNTKQSTKLDLHVLFFFFF